MSEEAEKVGSISQSRYERIVTELRNVVEQQTRGQFTIGDRALEIGPMRARGGEFRVDPQWTVAESLRRLAEDIGLAATTVKTARWVALRWPAEHRQTAMVLHRFTGSWRTSRTRPSGSPR